VIERVNLGACISLAESALSPRLDLPNHRSGLAR
jgi:hypothetical protein